MDPLQSTAGTEERRLANYLLGRYAAPAYARRARRVEDAYADLLDACRRQRDEWLEPVRWLLGELRDGYNRFYVLEKECAVHSPVIARQGFRPLEPLTAADLVAALPPLPVPRAA